MGFETRIIKVKEPDLFIRDFAKIMFSIRKKFMSNIRNMIF